MQSVFSISHNGSVKINGKEIINANGMITESALSRVIDGAPADMDTLNEIASAIEDTLMKGRYLQFTQEVKTETWIIEHTRNSTLVNLLRVIDDQGRVHVPASFRIVSDTTLELNFTSPVKGEALFSFFSL